MNWPDGTSDLDMVADYVIARAALVLPSGETLARDWTAADLRDGAKPPKAAPAWLKNPKLRVIGDGCLLYTGTVRPGHEDDARALLGLNFDGQQPSSVDTGVAAPRSTDERAGVDRRLELGQRASASADSSASGTAGEPEGPPAQLITNGLGEA